ncbi:MAG: hypothetical protein CL927_19340 [Deltaproteobacteria bacterium]|nr:hypothetical protein [Deltaproteobacteria bacterium]
MQQHRASDRSWLGWQPTLGGVVGLGFLSACSAKTPARSADSSPDPTTDTGSPDVSAPDEPGPWVVGHTSTALEDVIEPGRTLPIDIWYPAEPGSEAGATPAAYPLLGSIALPSTQAYDGLPVADLDAPLLIFSHGYGGIRIQSTALMEALASHGFVVASAGHTGNTQSAPEDSFDTAASRRVPDVQAVIDWFTSGAAPAADQVDLSRLGVLGHSFGGMTTLGVGAGWAGAPPIDGVGALMPISAVVDDDLQADDRSSSYAGFTAEQLATITQPVLLLGGTEDESVPVENNALAYDWLTGAAAVTRVDIIGANHTHFANVCDIGDLLISLGFEMDSWASLGAGPLIDPYVRTCTGEAFPYAEALRLQNLYAVAFFQLTLGERPEYGWWLTTEAAAEESAVALWSR